MKMDSVNVNFGAKFRYKDADTIASIAKKATGPQYHGLLGLKQDLVQIGDDKIVEHSIAHKSRYGKEKIGNLSSKVFRLVTTFKKYQQDNAPAYTLKSKSLSLDEIKKQAQDFVKVAETALHHNLSQEEINKVGAKPELVERYAALKSSQTL